MAGSAVWLERARLKRFLPSGASYEKPSFLPVLKSRLNPAPQRFLLRESLPLLLASSRFPEELEAIHRAVHYPRRTQLRHRAADFIRHLDSEDGPDAPQASAHVVRRWRRPRTFSQLRLC